MQEAADEHAAILDALSDGNTQEAVRMMEEHLRICYTSASSYIATESGEDSL